jgi:hypothetical protein
MDSSMRIELNGVLVTGRIDGTQNFEVTMRRSGNAGQTAKTFSSELTFYDDGYLALKTALIDDPNGFANEVPIKVFDACCAAPVFEGVIQGDAIDWCEPGCWISANAIETTPEINCIESTVIWDNWSGFLNQNRIAMRYCVEHRPLFIQYVIVFLAYMLINILTPLLLTFAIAFAAILAVIWFICSIVCVIPGTNCTQQDCNSDFDPGNAFELLEDINAEIAERVIPCGFFHPSAFVRDYIKNVCDKCGLTFQSSILNNPASPYWNTVLWAAQVKDGRKKNDVNYMLTSENLPVETLQTLLDNILNPTFNAQWRIFGNTLVFERKDYFQGTSVWVNTGDLLEQNRIENNEVCFSWIDKERWAFARFEYQLDAQDTIGNEARNRFNRIVEWNNPFNPSQSGQYNLSLPLSPVRTREDAIRTNVYEFFENWLGGAVNWAFFNAFSNYGKAMLINNDTAFNYKLLIWDGQSTTDGAVQSFYPDTFTGGNVTFGSGYISPGNRVNYPFWFLPGFDNNLYSLFHYIDNPRLPSATQWDFSFTFQFTCDDYQNFDWSKTVEMLKGGVQKFGQIEEIKFNFTNRTASVQGMV